MSDRWKTLLDYVVVKITQPGPPWLLETKTISAV